MAATIMVDTREHEHEWARIEKQFSELGIRYERSKLFIGDYVRFDRPQLVVDRKKNLEELCGNIFTSDHTRFRSELIRAQELQVQIVILIEHGEPIHCIDDVIWWDRPETIQKRKVDGKWMAHKIKKVAGDSLYKAMLTMSEKYGVKYAFCDKAHTGEAIARILHYDEGRN